MAIIDMDKLEAEKVELPMLSFFCDSIKCRNRPRRFVFDENKGVFCCSKCGNYCTKEFAIQLYNDLIGVLL